ncbi:hypothetical protein BGX28_005613 [Mortierella sp. GBA30]|nr:hypothetical protein BGX28_005613 [Mortierella sp. GBA30]
MEPSTSPRVVKDSTVVDIEKGFPSPDSTSSPGGSTFASPGSRSSPQSTSSTSGLAAIGPFAGLKRLFDRNPSTVISGRYTVNFRQLLILIMILMSFILMWFMFTNTAYGTRLEQDRQESFNLDSRKPGSSSNNDYETSHGDAASEDDHAFVSPESLTGAAKDRYERIRGKGSKTTLKKIQFTFPTESDEERVVRERRLKAVRDGFKHAWSGYKKHAWGHDEVRPVSGGYRDNFNGWGATMIDSLDTLVIMGFNEEFDEALQWIKTSFDMTKNPTSQLQFFETIIRYLGGLLSAYDLTGEKVLLDKAEELGNYMLNAFQNKYMPNGRVAVQKDANYPTYSFVLAEVASIQVEFTRLSMLTNNPVYDQKAQKIFEVLGTATSQLPGLLHTYVQDNTGAHYQSFKAIIGGMVDSYYEYLLKEWILLDGKVAQYKDMFVAAADAMAEYLVVRPDNGSQDYVVMGMVFSQNKAVEADMEHLACFVAGSLAMGSKFYDRPKDMVLAKQVAEGCYLSYHHSVTGLGPEAMKFEQNGKTFVANPDTYYSRSMSRRKYILRPETVESLWILYRLTGEKKYQEQAWEIFQSLEKSCRTSIAYSGLKDVNSPGSYDDQMESFFMAETLKYLYLMFSTPDVISLDDFVLNTEAHPVLRT